ncbi:MAG TPA: RIP metalloprotease RseP [Candidatus Angelobacter sp.]
MHQLIHSNIFAFIAMPDVRQWPIYVAAVAFVLGVLVFVHEFGHYAVAKLCGVRVEVFSLGFGKRLWGFRRGDTDYRISLLPLGGYVKMAGENPLESRTGDPGEFTSHPRWQRFLIAIAGPSMNVILALVVLTGLYMFRHGYDLFTRAPVDVVWVTPDSPAAKAGLQKGDRIIKAQDVLHPTWAQFQTTEFINTNQPMELTVQRRDRTLDMTVVPEPKGPDGAGEIGLIHPEVVSTVEPGQPAALAGVKEWDVLVSVDGSAVKSVQDLLAVLQKSPGKPVKLALLRDGKDVELSVTPKILPGFSDNLYRIGLSAVRLEQLPFRAALATAFTDCKDNSMLIFKLVGKLFRRPAAIQQLSGPIGIMKVSGEAAKIGFPTLLYVMAMISLNLAVVNLLPIPILDGGLMLMLLIEGVMRRDIKLEIKERVYQAAFVFLLLFFAVVIFNDVFKSFRG